MNRKDTLQAIYDSWGPLKRAMHAHFLEYFSELQFSPAQFEVLKNIHCSQPVSHKDLAKRLQLTPGAVSQLLESLEQSDLITRTPSPDDRRTIYISLSEHGHTTMKNFQKQRKQLLDSLFTTLSDSELETYLHIQQKLLQKIDDPSPSRNKE